MPTMKEKLEASDLGLTYQEAAHGVQTAKAFAYSADHTQFLPKHMRAGIDLRASDAMGLASLLIDKGVFTLEEYEEYMRLAANAEVVREEAAFPGNVRFR